ncbi:MAG TPA: O-antigen ligase family protein [Dissulfurispiraceae bacterium]|nr:O-antigen ligase family protein [Dissulfurispiraceae bacterium]
MKDLADISTGQSSFAHKVDRTLFWSFAALFFFLPIGTSPAVIAGILVLAIWVLSGKIIADRKRWMGEPWFWPLIVFTVLPWIGLLWTPDFKEGLNFASKTYYYLFAFALASVRLSEADALFLLKVFLSGLAVAAICSLLQLVTILPVTSGVPSLVGAKRILGGAFLAFGLCALLPFLILAQGVAMRLALAALATTFFIAFGMTGARSGYLGFLAVLPFLCGFFRRRFPSVCIAGIMIAVLLLLIAFGPFRDRMLSIQHEIVRFEQGDANSAAGERLHMWRGATIIFLGKPIFGTGTGGYKHAMKPFENESISVRDINNPHSSYFYMACSFGVAGILSLLWYFSALLRKGWTARSAPVGLAVLCYGVITVFLSFTSTPIIDFATANLLALMTGIRVADYEA